MPPASLSVGDFPAFPLQLSARSCMGLFIGITRLQLSWVSFLAEIEMGEACPAQGGDCLQQRKEMDWSQDLCAVGRESREGIGA